MKYPKQQFAILVKALEELNKHFSNLSVIHPCQIHYLVYQQASKGQEHNALFYTQTGSIVKGHIASDLGLPVVKLIDFLNEDNFLLYPEGCNDSHIETAVKAALKQLK